MSHTRRRACHENLEKKDTHAIATPFRGKKPLMLKRIVLVVVVTAVAVVAIIFAFKFYRHMTGEGDNQPGIIFERTDRPSRA